MQGFNIKDKHKEPRQENILITDKEIFNKTLKNAREEFEKLYFEYHMQKKLSVTELAKKSGFERTHLYRKLKSLGINTK